MSAKYMYINTLQFCFSMSPAVTQGKSKIIVDDNIVKILIFSV